MRHFFRLAWRGIPMAPCDSSLVGTDVPTASLRHCRTGHSSAAAKAAPEKIRDLLQEACGLGNVEDNRLAGLEDHPIAGQVMGTDPEEMARGAENSRITRP